MKLLLVDDNDRIRAMMRNLYSPHFDEVIECSDGTDAISAFKENKPDWVIMDIKMKKMDGIEATIKILSENPEAKVIIVSQFSDDVLIETAKNSGAVEFISKENLLKAIEVMQRTG